MRAKVHLANSAEVREGLLFVLGAGWNQVGPAPQPFAIAGLLEVDWDETNAKHRLEILFEDEDAAPLMVPTPGGEQPLRIATEFEGGRPPGVATGTSFNVPVALPLWPVSWAPGRRYVVKVSVDGNEVDRLSFSVRPASGSRPG
jgi:hypothetical protein